MHVRKLLFPRQKWRDSQTEVRKTSPPCACFYVFIVRILILRMLQVRHEQGAAFMADVYGRLTGKSAVAFGTLGMFCCTARSCESCHRSDVLSVHVSHCFKWPHGRVWFWKLIRINIFRRLSRHGYRSERNQQKRRKGNLVGVGIGNFFEGGGVGCRNTGFQD